MPGRACIDASLLLKLILPEPLAEEAAALIEAWDNADIELVAPSLLPYEVASSVYKNVQQGHLEPEVAMEGLRLLKQVEVQLFLPDDLDAAAWDIAGRCAQSVLYDSYYLALAEALDCDYWTADERFYRAAQGMFQRVRLLGRDHFVVG